MNKGIIIHLDNDKEQILDPAKSFFDQLDIALEYITCTSANQLTKLIEERKKEIKCIIFDLLEKESSEELKDHKQSAFYEAIHMIFNGINVPIFIYSGYLERFDDFKYNGTVIKVDKGNENGFKTVTDKIKLLSDSGFLDIFCPNGQLEQLLHKELHQAFVKQFVNDNDIENIIRAIKVSEQDVVVRTKEIFTRIALRSLISNLMIDKTVAEGFNEAFINVVEHYIRRSNIDNVQFWTGDIFVKNDKSETIIVLTPRCDLATKGKDTLLVCKIKDPEFSMRNALDYLKDKIKDKKFRYLPKTPIFEGGKIDLSDHSVVPMSILQKDYYYAISLSDDLTNEVLGKFCAYLLRTSIPEVNEKEFLEFLKSN